MHTTTTSSIAFATTDAEIAACFPVMRQLRPHLDEGDFVPRVRRMEAQGFRLAYARDGRDVVAVAGIRLLDQLVSGRVLYVDDLVTDAERRSGGFGRQLLEWVQAYARDEGCAYVDLDSGVWRADAHRFYFRAGYTILGFHFRSPALAPSGAAAPTPGPHEAAPRG